MSTQTSFALNLALEIFGLKRSSVSQKAFIVIAEESNLLNSQLCATFSAERALIDYSHRNALAVAAMADLEEASVRLERAKKRFDQGVVSQFEVLQSESDVTGYQANVTEANSNVEIALLNLRNSIGIDPKEEIGVMAEDYDFSKVPTMVEQGDPTKHPSLITLQNEIQASRQAVKNAEIARRPSVTLSVSYLNNDGPVRWGGQ